MINKFKMKYAARCALALCTGCLFAAPAVGAVPIIYPKNGQSSEQQSRDISQCQSWAVQQSGSNQSTPQAATSSTSAQPQGGVLRGGARGAAVGAIGGAIGGNAGEGAAIGAAVGGLGGGIRRRHQQQAAAQQNDEAVDAYNRAMAACLEGRGYTVK